MRHISWKPLAGALTVALVVLLAFWWLRRPQAPPGSPPAERPVTAPNVPSNPAHERAALLEELKKKPGHGPVVLRLAQLDLDAGELAGARKRLESLLAAEPANLDARLELGRVCDAAGDASCAEAQTRKILETHPGHVDALYNLGALMANQGLFPQARDYWTRAVRSAPQSSSGRKAEEALRAIASR